MSIWMETLMLRLCAFLMLISWIVAPTAAQETFYEVIMPGNGGRLQEVGRFGRGAMADMALSADGQILAMGGASGIWLYAASDFTLLHHLATSEPVWKIAWHPDGTFLAGSFFQEVIIWETTDWREVARLMENRGEMSWSPDGSLFISSGGNVVNIWEGRTFALVDSISVYSGVLAFSPDGTYLYAAGEISTIDSSTPTLSVVDIPHQTVPIQMYDLPLSVMSIAPAHNGLEVIYGGWGQTVYSADYQLQNPQSVLKLDEHRYISSISWSPDDLYFSIGASDGKLYIFDGATRTLQKTLFIENVWNVVDHVWLTPTTIAVLYRDQTVRLWDIDEQVVIHQIDDHTAIITRIAWSEDSRYLAATSIDGNLRIWDVDEGVLERNLYLGIYPHSYGGLAWSKDGQKIMYSSSRDVILYDLVNQRIALKLEFDDSVEAFAWSPNEAHVIVRSDDHVVSLWDVSTGELLAEPPCVNIIDYEVQVFNLAWSPDGKMIGCLANDRVRVFYADDLHQRWEIRSYHSAPRFLNFIWAADGRSIAVAHTDGSIAIWDLVDEVSPESEFGQFRSPMNYGGGFSQLDWSPDNQLFALLYEQEFLALMDANTGEQVYPVSDQESTTAYKFTFSPDGRFLAYHRGDGILYLMGVPAQ